MVRFGWLTTTIVSLCCGLGASSVLAEDDEPETCASCSPVLVQRWVQKNFSTSSHIPSATQMSFTSLLLWKSGKVPKSAHARQYD